MTKQEQIDELNRSIEAMKESVALFDALQKLQSNRAFKALFTAYTQEEALRVVDLLADANTDIASRMDNIGVSKQFLQEQLAAVGHFKNFLRNVEQEGRQAVQGLAINRETLEEVMAEEE